MDRTISTPTFDKVHESEYLKVSTKGMWGALYEIARLNGPLRISARSTFEQNTWDLRKEGARDRFIFKSIIGSIEPGFLPLLILVKLIVKSLIGSESIQDRSLRTVLNILSASKKLMRWLVKEQYLVSNVEGGYFKLASEIDFHSLASFYSEISGEDWHQNTKWDNIRFLSEWWKVSNSGETLPKFLRLSNDPLAGNKVSDVVSASEEFLREGNNEGWQPIPLEFAFPLASAAADYIENYGEALVKYFNIVHVGILECQAGSGIARGRLEKECLAHGVTMDELAVGLPFVLQFYKYVTPSNPRNFTYKLERKIAEKCLAHIKLAAVTIIFFTTGMRSRELRELRVGCCVKDYNIGVDDFYRMTVTVKKTSEEYEQGQIITIPVPKITYDAVKVLEGLGSVNRREDYLVAPLMANEKEDHVHGPVSSMTVINYVKGFADAINLSYKPHPHQFRKTIAGWFALNSPVLGPLLVMRLFSHKSIAMTEMYLKNNPFIQAARQEMLMEQSLKLIKNISRAAQQGKVAGVVGEKIKSLIHDDSKFLGLTGDVLGATLEEYLKERALHGSLHFLLTPLAVCAFDPDDESVKPCSNIIASTDALYGEASLVAQMELPIASKCVGVRCDKCLVTANESPKLEQSMEFYKELSDGAIAEDFAQNLHLLASARTFVEQYTPVLEALK